MQRYAKDKSSWSREDKKEEIWLSPKTKAPTPTEMSKGQSDNTNNATKSSIKHRLWTDLEGIIFLMERKRTGMLTWSRHCNDVKWRYNGME